MKNFKQFPIYFLLNIIIFFYIFIFFQSCKPKEKNDLKPEEKGSVWVLNQGTFTFGNASLSSFNKEEKIITNNVFFNVNNFILGDVLNSAEIINDKLYLIVNNSQKIEIINKNSAAHIKTIEGFTSPRYILKINETKAYVSDIDARKIWITDLIENKITGFIPFRNNTTAPWDGWAEQMVLHNNEAFICGVKANKIFVINTETNEITDSISVGYEPICIVKDKNNYLWVLSNGGVPPNKKIASLHKINCINKKVEQVYLFNSLNNSPGLMQINEAKNEIIFADGNEIFKFNVDNLQWPLQTFIKTSMQNLYALNFDETEKIYYTADAKDLIQPGIMYRYNAQKELIDSFKTGVAPAGFVFVK